MSRVGFKKSFGAGGMDASTLYSEFYLTLKTHLTTAGFVTLLDDQVDPGFEEYFHFIQAGADGATEHDDVPRWMIRHAGAALHGRSAHRTGGALRFASAQRNATTLDAALCNRC